MRDPDRIESFLAELGAEWKATFPDWRFGQLMYNFLAEMGDPFYWEEDYFLRKFKEYADRFRTPQS